MDKERKVFIGSDSIRGAALLTEVIKHLEPRTKTILSVDIVNFAIALVRQGLPDLLLLHVEFPTWKIMHPLMGLKSDSRYHRVAKIVLSSKSDTQWFHACMTAGADQCFFMPDRPSAVKALVKQILTDYCSLRPPM